MKVLGHSLFLNEKNFLVLFFHGQWIFILEIVFCRNNLIRKVAFLFLNLSLGLRACFKKNFAFE